MSYAMALNNNYFSWLWFDNDAEEERKKRALIFGYNPWSPATNYATATCQTAARALNVTHEITQSAAETVKAFSQTASNITRRAANFIATKARAAARNAWEHKGELFFGGIAGNLARHGTKAIAVNFVLAAGVTTLPAILAVGITAGAIAGAATRLTKTYVYNRGKAPEEKKSYKEGLLSSVAFGAIGGSVGAYLFEHIKVGHLVRDFFSVSEASAAPIPDHFMLPGASQAVAEGFDIRVPMALGKALDDSEFYRLTRAVNDLLPSQMEDLTILAEKGDLVGLAEKTAQLLNSENYKSLADVARVAGLSIADEAGTLNTLPVARMCLDYSDSLIQNKDYATAFANAQQALESLKNAQESDAVKQQLLKKANKVIKLCVQKDPSLKQYLTPDAAPQGNAIQETINTAPQGNAVQEAIAGNFPGSHLPKELSEVMEKIDFGGASYHFDHLSASQQQRLLKILAPLAKETDLVKRSKILASFCKETSYELSKKGYAYAADMLEVAGLNIADGAGALNTVTVAQLCVDHAGSLSDNKDYATAFANAKQALASLKEAPGSAKVKKIIQQRAEGIIKNCIKKAPELKAHLG
jgi:hypothetical protein